MYRAVIQVFKLVYYLESIQVILRNLKNCDY